MKYWRVFKPMAFIALGILIISACAILTGANQKLKVEDFPCPVASSTILNLPYEKGTAYAQAEDAVIRTNVEGKVIYAGSDPLLGQKVIIDCSEGWQVVYGGLKNLRVRTGDYVYLDQAIGQIGAYPNSTGDIRPHLYYEVRHEEGNK